MADLPIGTLSGVTDSFASSAILSALPMGTLAGIGAAGSSGVADARVTRADVWARDFIQLVFAQAMRNEASLRSGSSYTVARADTGVVVPIVDVMAPEPESENPTVWEIFLVTHQVEIGVDYIVTAATTLRSATGVALKPGENTARFIGRRTKVDVEIESRPPLYTIHHRSLHRALLNAMLHPIEVLGGDRNDRLP